MPVTANSRRRLALAAEGLAALLAYAVAAVYFTWPLAASLSDHIVWSPIRYDTLLVIWILRWGVHALGTDPLRLFDANAFHPARGVLARSEHLLGELPLFAPLWAASGNPVLSFNVVLLLSFALSGLFMYVLVRCWTASRTAAYVSGFAFAFAPLRLAGLSSPHLLHFQYLPLVLLGLERAAAGSFAAAALTALVLAIQVLCSYYLGYSAYALVAVFVVLTIAMRRLRSPRAATALGVAVLLPLIVIVPLSVPYWHLRTSHAFARQTTALETFSRQLLSLMSDTPPVGESSAGWMPLALARLTQGFVTMHVSWGTVALALVAMATLGRRRIANDQRTFRLLCLISTAAVGWLLVLGPVLRAGSLPSLHGALAWVVPGFSGLRTTTRFATLVSFGLSGLAGLGFYELARRVRRRWLRILLASAATAAVLAHTAHGSRALWKVPVGEAVPPVYRWLAANGGGQPVLELPTRGSIDPYLVPALAMYFSTYHWLPLVNGYTGYTPPFSAFLENYASQLPSEEALQLLVDCTKIRWIVARAQTAARRREWRKLPGVRVVPGFDREGLFEEWLLEVVARPRRSCRDALFQAERTIDGRAMLALRSLEGVLSMDGLSGRGQRGGERLARVHLANSGEEAWPCTAIRGENRVELVIRWLDESGVRTERLDTVLLPRDIAPGEALELPIWLRYPEKPGRYRLRVALRQTPRAGQPAPQPILWQRRVEVR